MGRIFELDEQQRPAFADQRGLVRSALEYAHNHCDALHRFFDDGRLVLTNTAPSARSSRSPPGAKLGCGSDDRAKSTAALFSLASSARLHGLDPEEYLRCLIRLVPLWPAERMLELSPLCWNQTRLRLDPKALAAELRPIAIPEPPLDTRPSPRRWLERERPTGTNEPRSIRCGLIRLPIELRARGGVLWIRSARLRGVPKGGGTSQLGRYVNSGKVLTARTDLEFLDS